MTVCVFVLGVLCCALQYLVSLQYVLTWFIKSFWCQAKGVKLMNYVLTSLYYRGYWIPAAEGLKIGQALGKFLQTYALCSHLCQTGHTVSPNRFTMVPKLHYLAHISERLVVQGSSARWCQNPLAESVQCQEDYIGKPCRLSRRVSPKALHARTIDRSLLASFRALFLEQEVED